MESNHSHTSCSSLGSSASTLGSANWHNKPELEPGHVLEDRQRPSDDCVDRMPASNVSSSDKMWHSEYFDKGWSSRRKLLRTAWQPDQLVFFYKLSRTVLWLIATQKWEDSLERTVKRTTRCGTVKTAMEAVSRQKTIDTRQYSQTDWAFNIQDRRWQTDLHRLADRQTERGAARKRRSDWYKKKEMIRLTQHTSTNKQSHKMVH